MRQVTAIAAGRAFSLAIHTNSVTALGSLWAWGGNYSGELGDGTTTDHHTPEHVTGVTAPSIAGITAGVGFPRPWAVTARSGHGEKTSPASSGSR